MVLGQYRSVLIDTWWYWLIYDGTGSVEGGTGWYLVVLGQNRAILVASVICFQKMYGLHSVNHQIIQYSEKEKVITDRQMDGQTNKQTEFPI